MLLVPTATIAKAAGISHTAVHQRAERRKIKPALMVGRAKLWSPGDAELLMVDMGRGWVAKRRHEVSSRKLVKSA